MALLLGEEDNAAIAALVQRSENVVIAAPTKFELLLVASNRITGNGVVAAHELLESLSIRTIEWTDGMADIASQAFEQFGKGRHKAALNFGDCMAYALAKALDAPLLYKTGDFALTDLRSAL